MSSSKHAKQMLFDTIKGKIAHRRPLTRRLQRPILRQSPAVVAVLTSTDNPKELLFQHLFQPMLDAILTVCVSNHRLCSFNQQYPVFYLPKQQESKAGGILGPAETRLHFFATNSFKKRSFFYIINQGCFFPSVFEDFSSVKANLNQKPRRRNSLFINNLI